MEYILFLLFSVANSLVLNFLEIYLKSYRAFFSTHSFYEGLRMTIGIMVPILTAARFDQIGWGLAMAVGALCVSLADNAGPFHHRINGMMAALGFMLTTSLLTGFLLPFQILTIILLFLFGFSFSIIGIFGSRAASIGTAILVAITLQLTASEMSVLQNALLTAAGGLWYFLLSITLYRLRPYKLAQQVLGDCLEETGAYLKIKAQFFYENPDFADTYNALLQAQVRVHNKQETVREILFKTRGIVKESTHIGRVLVLIFLETVDIFEVINKSEKDYKVLHEKLDKTKLLPLFADVINQIATDLAALAMAVKEGRPFTLSPEIFQKIKSLEQSFANGKIHFHTNDNADSLLGLHRILENIILLHQKAETIASLSAYQKEEKYQKNIDYARFVVPSYINKRLLIENLHKNSNIFRYSIRMGLSLSVGYIFSLLFPLGHGYWILLTIVVILKPAYALTAQRNKERLFGTIIGGVAAMLILMFISPKPILLVIMIMSMIAAFSLMRIRYLLSVAMLTAYVLVGLYLLQPGEYVLLLKDRIIDTALGSVIAFSFTRIIPPIWEREQIMGLLKKTIETNLNYFIYSISYFKGQKIEPTQYKWYRKETYVALANLSDAFQRMLNEPKRHQQSGVFLHPLIVSCHVLTSRIASLLGYHHQEFNEETLGYFDKMTNAIGNNLNSAIQLIDKNDGKTNLSNQQGIGMETQSIERFKINATNKDGESQEGLLQTSLKAHLVDIFNLTHGMKELTGKLKGNT